MITVINIYERKDGSLTFRPGKNREPYYVVLGCRRNPELRVPVSEESDLAYVRTWEMSAEAIFLAASSRRLGLRIYREKGKPTGRIKARPQRTNA